MEENKVEVQKKAKMKKITNNNPFFNLSIASLLPASMLLSLFDAKLKESFD